MMPNGGQRERYIFSIRDLLALIAGVAILLALLSQLIGYLRGDARRNTCRNHFKELGLALHNYHSAFKILPSAMGGTNDNANRMSGLVGLTPFMFDGKATWNKISNSMVGGVNYPPMGPVPWDTKYPPWTQQFYEYRCPDDPMKKSTYGLTNYVFCVGDSITNVHSKPSINEVRGMFAPGHALGFRDITDGLSNTIAMMETATQRSRELGGQFVVDLSPGVIIIPSDCKQFIDVKNSSDYSATATLSRFGRGGMWADGAGGHSLAHSILPPNSPSCAIGGTAPADGVFSASSRHLGGCHILMGDGAVVFVTNSIDTGSMASPAPTSADGFKVSPFGLWGALGTRASDDAIVSQYP